MSSNKQTNRKLDQIRVGAWWKLKPSYAKHDKNRYSGPRQIAEIDASDPLAPKIRWRALPDSRFTNPRATTVASVVGNYIPCDPPETAKLAPKPNGHDASNGASNYLRDIVREEIARGHERNNGYLRAIIREELEAALAALRPAVREEALAAVHAAFGETRQ